MAGELTNNAIQQMFQGRAGAGFTPTLQVIDLRQIAPSASVPQDRYRLILSDGDHYQQGMLTSQLNHLVTSGQLQCFSIVRLNEFVVNNIASKKIIIALNLSIVSPPNGRKEIGQPVGIDSDTANKQPQQQQQQQQPQQQQNYNQYAQPQQQRAQRQLPFGGGSSGGGSGGGGGAGGGYNMPNSNQNVVPVASLNPYRGKWTIKVRVTAKSNVRHWNKSSGSGKVFSVDLLDGDKGEIRASMFNEAVDKYEDLFQVGKVYLISGGRVKAANKKFSSLRNDYEFTLDLNSFVEPVQDDANISNQQYFFVKIGDLSSIPERQNVDVLAIVKRIDPIGVVNSSKTNKQLNKRNILLADETGTVELTVWEEMADKYNEEVLKDCPVVCVKSARVSDFGGRSLSLSGTLEINADLPEVSQLKSWWDSEGSGAQLPALSTGGHSTAISDTDQFITISEIRDRQIGRRQDGKVDYFVVKGTITSLRNDISRPPFYLSCTNERAGRICQKKVERQGDEYWCETCARSFKTCEARYIIGFALNDHSGSYWMNCFNDIGEKIMGVPAEDIRALCEESNEARFMEIMSDAQFQTKLFKARAKLESYNDEEKVKCTVVTIEDIDYARESMKLINILNSMQ